MDIQVISKSCAKIILTKLESENLDIGFDTFESETPETRTFLTYIIAVMSDMGIIHSPKDKISVEIFEQENGDMIIYISSFPSEEIVKYRDYIFTTDNPKELFELAAKMNFEHKQSIINPELYFYEEIYHLIFKSTYSENSINKMFETSKITKCTALNMAKIKEYGTFLCDTPFEKLI